MITVATVGDQDEDEGEDEVEVEKASFSGRSLSSDDRCDGVGDFVDFHVSA